MPSIHGPFADGEIPLPKLCHSVCHYWGVPPTDVDQGLTDGRRQRGLRNREAVVDAILALINETGELPAVGEVAERSGVSVRSVFRHFEDLESLHAVAVERHMRSVMQIIEPVDQGAPLADRVAAVVDQRSRLFETITPMRRVAERLQHTSSAVADGLTFSLRSLRRHAIDSFAPELDALPAPARRDAAAAVDVALSWATWNHVRTAGGCSVARAEAVVSGLVRGVLAPPGGG